MERYIRRAKQEGLYINEEIYFMVSNTDCMIISLTSIK